MIRREWPGVAPWEWEQHPEWHSRAQTALIAEIDAAQIKAEAEKADDKR